MNKEKITIEASNIYFGGGYVLLKTIINYLEIQEIKSIVYINYNDVFMDLKSQNLKHCELIKSTSFKTIIRYFLKRESIIFFCNLPPFVKNKKSVTYFQNVLFLNRPKLKLGNLKHIIYYYWVNTFCNKSEYVACQTEHVAFEFRKKSKNVKILPFFEEFSFKQDIKKYDFCYVCSNDGHKNINRLLDAIDLLSAKCNFNIVLTLSNNQNGFNYIKKIEEINTKYNRDIIINLGHIPKNEIIQLYLDSKALVFPSLKESLALPLIEAIMCNSKVLTSDLPYGREVIDNPITFDPKNSENISEVMLSFLNGKYDTIEQNILIKSKLEDLINLIR